MCTTDNDTQAIDDGIANQLDTMEILREYLHEVFNSGLDDAEYIRHALCVAANAAVLKPPQEKP